MNEKARVVVKTEDFSRNAVFIATIRIGWRRYRATGHTQAEAMENLRTRVVQVRANKELKRGYPREIDL